MEKQNANLAIMNPNKVWVVQELDKLINEWEKWQKEVAQIKDYPYDSQTKTDVFADGEENMQKHEILQAKTLAFLNNNIKGHGFIIGFDGKHCDRTDLRLKHRVKHRLQQLKILQASLQYAQVPDSFWKKKGKELIDKIAGVAPEVAAKIATGMLKNPTS